MSDNGDDDAGYEPVTGFSIPFKRVLGMNERPENPDGSRSGSLFWTIEGCTFKHDGLKGDAAATVGAPTVVVTVGDAADAMSGTGQASRYVVRVHDIVEAAIKAHKARFAKEPKEVDL